LIEIIIRVAGSLFASFNLSPDNLLSFFRLFCNSPSREIKQIKPERVSPQAAADFAKEKKAL